ncbi:hypothetical protein POJ06DRAFT_19913 [Lipomyces tetrasporus]|uniref:Uncharacterized protein n=1 Tax=Lipomyces tetrasporus TaxID=54092 RepID=A0AAD7VQL0_9ASCO|nr:uncharacterized protein POJ06DRAFT_19913 [Lipomyces tetrasporus]KAJ8097704.1 hypothetical protein POJ06DRAFT_19913 [Lipomyces tetrasporus]
MLERRLFAIQARRTVFLSLLFHLTPISTPISIILLRYKYTLFHNCTWTLGWQSSRSSFESYASCLRTKASQSLDGGRRYQFL